MLLHPSVKLWFSCPCLYEVADREAFGQLMENARSLVCQPRELALQRVCIVRARRLNIPRLECLSTTTLVRLQTSAQDHKT